MPLLKADFIFEMKPTQGLKGAGIENLNQVPNMVFTSKYIRFRKRKRGHTYLEEFLI